MKNNLGELFKKWQDLNSKVAESFGQFEFESIKVIRKEQRKIEDSVYSELLKTAPDEIRKILPETCGDMEIGYEISKNTFYFLMEDPEQDESDKINILAITIDLNKKVNTIKNFQPNKD